MLIVIVVCAKSIILLNRKWQLYIGAVVCIQSGIIAVMLHAIGHDFTFTFTILFCRTESEWARHELHKGNDNSNYLEAQNFLKLTRCLNHHKLA